MAADNFYGKADFSTKIKTSVKVSRWVPHAPSGRETEQQLTVVRILVLATYALSTGSLSDPVESGDVSHTGDGSSVLALHSLSVQFLSYSMYRLALYYCFLFEYLSYPNILWSQSVWISDFLLYS